MAAQLDHREHEERRRIADAIDRRAREIVERWLAQVTADAEVRKISVTELRDAIREYLKHLAEALRADEPLHLAGTTMWSDVARRHALTHVRLGFDVGQLIRELVVLRSVLDNVLEEEELDAPRWERLLLNLIDDAMASTLQSYVEFRDYQMRRSEAEHIGFLTHEIKNPLGTVVLAMEQLRSHTLSDDDRRLSDIIVRNLDRIRRTIDDVLLTERLGVGEVASRPVDLTLHQLVEEMLGTFQTIAGQKHVGLAAEYDPELRLYADPNLTRSALENLIDNAIKYTDTGDVTFAVVDNEAHLEFHVRDRCHGISAEELRVIFEPFKRASSKAGTGLGLAIARRSVEAQGGTMYAESSGQSGCHFWFTLPKTHH